MESTGRLACVVCIPFTADSAQGGGGPKVNFLHHSQKSGVDNFPLV